MSTRAAVVNHLRDYDWAEAQYRSGRPLREVADDIGVARSQLFDYFSKRGVAPTLGTKIVARRERLLADSYVPQDGLMPVDEESIIAINATMQAAVIREHREDIRRMRYLCMQLLAELEGVTLYGDLFEDLGTMLRTPDEKGTDRLNDLYRKVISLPERSVTLKRLGETLSIVIKLEREAFGMNMDFEDDVIRKSKIARTSKPGELTGYTDYDAITKKFMKVLGHITEETPLVQDATPAG